MSTAQVVITLDRKFTQKQASAFVQRWDELPQTSVVTVCVQPPHQQQTPFYSAMVLDLYVYIAIVNVLCFPK